ncbi:MAG: AAA family ATPase [Acidimicrobiia bacterium]
MRPKALVLEGFLAYRHRVEIDFEDADLFVLSGPTGSGKSSVIDGMTFALYGTIPRLEDRRSVSPVISAQADRARVSFRFSVGDETYTAVRLVERTKTGARVTEARLQQGTDEVVLAGTADDVTAEVTRLLGLTYDHFIKAVVLPQGAFSDFLTDRPRERQALLKALLDLGLYEQVMQLANLRARGAEARAETMRESLDKLDVPTPEQLEEARLGMAAMAEAMDQLPERMEGLHRLQKKANEAVAAGEAIDQVIALLTSITLPSDLETLNQDRSSALGRLGEVRETRVQLTSKRAGLETSISALHDLKALEAWHDGRVQLRALLDKRASLDVPGLIEVMAHAAEGRDRAREELDTARAGHAAHGLREGLQVGDTCPVCHAVVSTLPGAEPAEAAQLEALSADLIALEEKAAATRDLMKHAEGEAKQIDAAVAENEEKLRTAPDPETVEAELSSLHTFLTARQELEVEIETTAKELAKAEMVVSGLEERAAALKEKLLAARDLVAAEAPPLPGEDAVEGWRRFDEWRLETIDSRKADRTGLSAAVDEAKSALKLATTGLQDWLAGLGVESTGAPDKDLALAMERRSSEVGELEKTIAEATEMGAKLEEEDARGRVASALGNHLRANHFEAWLLEEAMEVLIDGANQLLHELSAGNYSLKARDSQFEVVDHRNAELTRTTKSLSGGETFLVALSLALSMADQLAELTGMSSRLESVFLDEGFGSLDQESLDVVATVLDELAGRGRTVGIVTHVRDLADRMPIRFEVTKGPETASIVRVGE